MKFEKTEVFDRDVRRLSAEEKARFRKVINESFNPACDRRAKDPAERWPTALRIKPMKSRPEVLEMTWDQPDGRATFEWIIVDGEARIRWRRVGGHGVLTEP